MRKPTLLAFALAAISLVATPARADPVEVEDKFSGQMCSTRLSTGCPAHFTSSNADFVIHTFLGEFSYECDVELYVRFVANGSGATETSGVEVTDGDSSTCDEDIVPCEEPWGALISHDGFGSESIDFGLCIDPPIIDTCEGALHALLQSPVPYRFELADAEIEGDPNCEFTGDYTVEISWIEVHHV